MASSTKASDTVQLPRDLIVWRVRPQIKNPRVIEVYLEGTDPEDRANIIILWCRSNKGWKKRDRIPASDVQMEGQVHVLKPYGPYRRFRKKTA